MFCQFSLNVMNFQKMEEDTKITWDVDDVASWRSTFHTKTYLVHIPCLAASNASKVGKLSKCLQSLHSGWEKRHSVRRRIFNISDTINCFKPFKCQAALFKLGIVSVSTFVVVVVVVGAVFMNFRLCAHFHSPSLARTNFIYLHFMKSALFHLTFYKWLRVFFLAIFNGRCQHSTSRLQFCCSSNYCWFLLTIILSATTKWI